MSQVKEGSKVKVHYVGKLEDGTVFDSSENRPPLEFEIGKGNVITGFETGVIGMELNGKKTVTIVPDDAYGHHREELMVEVSKGDFPPDIDPNVGQQLQIKRPDGHVIDVTITGVEGDKVTLDANHPLAGKTLIFEIELVEIA
ncbi:MAG: peptidylprolyl isomerase [candidate division Zixibacteria bacterium HGW-Zixibacteria-1]|nr:MAG: peptidylprolyl isomerase [candidate division Zixibacteria bacterium HGW-Zixibacteria-1]